MNHRAHRAVEDTRKPGGLSQCETGGGDAPQPPEEEAREALALPEKIRNRDLKRKKTCSLILPMRFALILPPRCAAILVIQ